MYAPSTQLCVSIDTRILHAHLPPENYIKVKALATLFLVRCFKSTPVTLSPPVHSQLYFIPKTLHGTSVFSSFLTAYFCLTGHSPVFIYNTALLYIVLLALCGHLQTQRVCRALHPVSGEDGILVAEVPRGVQHASSARTCPRRVVE